MLEDSKRVLEIEFFVHNGGAVGLHAVVGQVFLFSREKVRMRSRLREVPESKDRECDCTTTLHNEEVAPIGKISRLDLEHTESEEPRKRGGNALGGVEQGKAAGEFVAAVESVVIQVPTRAIMRAQRAIWCGTYVVR